MIFPKEGFLFVGWFGFQSLNRWLQKKIRDAEIEKIPYMIIIGEKEESIGMISVRSKAQGDVGRMKLGDFIDRVKKEIKEKVR